MALAESIHHSPTGTEDGQGRGVGTRCTTRRSSRRNTPQEPGTRYFALDDDDSVPELKDSRPDRLFSVSGPQERVQRHTVEQNIDTFAAVPMLDAPVPLVGQLVEVLKIVDTMVPDVEQVIKVHKIALEDGIPRCGELREPRVVELRRDVARLVEVRHRTAMEVLRWCSNLVRRGVALTSEEYHSMLLLMPDSGWRSTASPGRKTNTGRQSDVPVIMQRRFVLHSEGASNSVHRPSWWTFLCAQDGML